MDTLVNFAEKKIKALSEIGNIISEQFSEQDIKMMAESVGLKVIDYKKIEGIAYLVEMVKS